MTGEIRTFANANNALNFLPNADFTAGSAIQFPTSLFSQGLPDMQSSFNNQNPFGTLFSTPLFNMDFGSLFSMMDNCQKSLNNYNNNNTASAQPFNFTMPKFNDYKPQFNLSIADKDNISKSNAEKFDELDPKMQDKTAWLIAYAKTKLGKEVTINSGYRTQEEQARLRAEKPHLAAERSAHCEGKAVDLSIVGGSDEDYAALGDYAKSIGMRWGGDFSKVKERWHFDYDWA